MVSMMDTCGAVGPNTWTLTWVLWQPEKHAWMFGMLRECRICRFQFETSAVGPNANTWTVTWILWWLGMHAWMWGHAEGVRIAISDIKRRTLPARDKYIGKANKCHLLIRAMIMPLSFDNISWLPSPKNNCGALAYNYLIDVRLCKALKHAEHLLEAWMLDGLLECCRWSYIFYHF